MIELMPHQEEALWKLGNGKILWGGVGSGKSMVALAYHDEFESDRELIVITTAKKRDTGDWDAEADALEVNRPEVVDSWNNISKYEDAQDAFFVFDEQRLVGSGAWVKSFLKIAKRNRWILLSATPGDSWMDYTAVFIANRYFKNITEFKIKHVVYAARSRYPKIVRYLGEDILERFRSELLVEMPFEKHTERMLNWLEVEYDHQLYDVVVRRRWNPYEDEPIKDIAELFRVIRRVVNTDPSRLEMIRKLMTCHPKVVIFYNFNYELELLRTLGDDFCVAEWNGHKKEPIPDQDEWIYLVQYHSGSEGWNCTDTDAMILYSLTYSYKNFEQAQGRIDRLDTPFSTLFYYILASNSEIDRAVRGALMSKKDFNERRFFLAMDQIDSILEGLRTQKIEKC